MSAHTVGRTALGMMIPAALAGLVAFLFLPGPGGRAPISIAPGESTPPAQLARMAGTEPLRPIVIRGGHAVLGHEPAGPATNVSRPAEPSHISIPALGVSADVQHVSSTATGIEVPQVGRAGWFDEGPRPGEPGRAVVIGHLDSSDGPSVFARVPELRRDARIEVVDERGAVHGYRVVGATRVRKKRFPTGAVYGHARHPVLVLVTCGGPYVAGRGYRDNVLVYARAA